MWRTSRLQPTWWDHQRQSLIRLRRQIEYKIGVALKPKPGQTVVDLDCGDMPHRPLFKRLGCRYVGCDLDEAPVRIESGAPVSLPDAASHGVVSFQVLEHVRDLDWYLGECRRLLRPDGWLLLSTHGAWLYHPQPTDYRRWTRQGHLGHHRHLGTEEDPDRAIHSAVNKSSLFSFLVYITGIAALGGVFKRVTGLAETESTAQDNRPGSFIASRWPAVAAQVVALLVINSVLPWWYFFVFWVAPLYCLLYVPNGIRAFCEHAHPVLPDTRCDSERLVTFVPNRLERMFMAPMNTNYHAEHHLWPAVP